MTRHSFERPTGKSQDPAGNDTKADSLCCTRWCDIDLAAFFGPGGADRVRDGWYTLLDPSNSAIEVSIRPPLLFEAATF